MQNHDNVATSEPNITFLMNIINSLFSIGFQVINPGANIALYNSITNPKYKFNLNCLELLQLQLG